MQSSTDTAVAYLRLLWPETDDLDGCIAVQCKSDKLTKHVPVARVEDAAKYIVEQAEQDTVYIGMGLRRPGLPAKQSGGRGDIVAIPGLWADLDIAGPGHAEKELPPTLDDALAVVDALPLKPSLVLHSGGGIYPLWLLKEPWTLETEAERIDAESTVKAWERVIHQEGVRRGYCFDTVGNLARILKPVGAINHKGEPVPVTILRQDTGCRYLADDFEAFFMADMPPTTAYRADHADPDAEKTADAEEMARNCAFVRHCIDDAATLPEPQWFAMMTLLGRCIDGRLYAHEWSRAYPRYTREETNKKFSASVHQDKPFRCDTIASSFDFAGCKTCKFSELGLVSSPVELGRLGELQDIDEPDEPVAVTSNAEPPAEKLADLLGNKHFRAAWELTSNRTDCEDEIVRLAVMARWSNADVERLLNKFCAKHALPPLDATDVAVIVATARDKITAEESQGEAQRGIDAVVAGHKKTSREGAIELLQKMLGIPITGVVRYLKEPDPDFVIETTLGNVLIGTADVLLSPKLFQRRVGGMIRRVCNIPKKKDWATSVGQLLLNVARDEFCGEEATEKGFYLVKLRDYLISKPPCDFKAQDAANQTAILRNKTPFLEKGTVYVQLAGFAEYLRMHKIVHVDEQKLGPIMARAGCVKTKKHNRNVFPVPDEVARAADNDSIGRSYNPFIEEQDYSES